MGTKAVNHHPNTTTMVVSFADSAAWDWWISPPHPWEPLPKGLAEGGVWGFYFIHLTGREKNDYYAQQFI